MRFSDSQSSIVLHTNHRDGRFWEDSGTLEEAPGILRHRAINEARKCLGAIMIRLRLNLGAKQVFKGTKRYSKRQNLLTKF